MREVGTARRLSAGFGRWLLALTALVIVAGPPTLMALGARDPIRVLDFTVPGVSIVYLGSLVIAMMLLIDSPAPYPSVHRTPMLVRSLIVASGWGLQISLVFLLGDSENRLPDMVRRDPVTGEIDYGATVPAGLWMVGGLGTSVVVLAGCFFAVLITGRTVIGARGVDEGTAGRAISRGIGDPDRP